jgi:hypothetical protein
MNLNSRFGREKNQSLKDNENTENEVGKYEEI